MRWEWTTSRSGHARKGQISMEYLAVVGMSLLFTIPLIVIYAQQTNTLSDDINNAHLEKVSKELMGAAEEVYYYGPPTQKQLRLHFPEHITAITIGNQTITFTIQFSQTTIDHYVDSTLPLNLTGSLEIHSGLHVISISAENNGVAIQEVY